MIDNSMPRFEDTPLSVLPGTVVGYRRNGSPIYTIAGGAADVVVSDKDDDDSDTDDTDDIEDEEDTWAPPTKEEWEKTLALKAKADSESAARKRFLRAAGYDPKTGSKVEKPSLQLDDVDDDTDTDTADVVRPKKDETAFDREKFEKQFQRQLERETQKAERSGRATAYSLIHEVPNALEDAGWNGKNLPRMIKLLDLDSLEIDQDGIDADQLLSQVAELKRDFPEFFKRSRMKEAAKEVADTKTVGGGTKQAPASEEDMDWKTRMKLQLQQGK